MSGYFLSRLGAPIAGIRVQHTNNHVLWGPLILGVNPQPLTALFLG